MRYSNTHKQFVICSLSLGKEIKRRQSTYTGDSRPDANLNGCLIFICTEPVSNRLKAIFAFIRF